MSPTWGYPFLVGNNPPASRQNEAVGLIVWMRLELSRIPLVERIDGKFEPG